MRIGLISDTHVAWGERELPQQALEAFQGVDLILHGGDIYTHSVLDALERIAPVLAALGDDDYLSSDKRVKEKHVLQLEGHTIWLVHEGPPTPLSALGLSSWWQKRVAPHKVQFSKPDIIISGHEHRTLVERCDGILCINSGSPTLLHYKSGLGTVGILELKNGKADVNIIQLK